MIKLFIILQCVIIGCAHSLPYSDDTYYASSGEAGSYEHSVMVNGNACKDITGKVGACTIGIKRMSSLSLVFLPRQYAYSLFISCTNGISTKRDILADKQFPVTISPERWVGFDEVSCLGVISPIDRPEAITSKFRLFVTLMDNNYQAREEIYKDGNNIILGHFAKYVHGITYPQNKYFTLLKTTMIPWPKKATDVCIETESHKARFNFQCLK